jgi:polyisoprenoid-binding protein YceI
MHKKIMTLVIGSIISINTFADIYEVNKEHSKVRFEIEYMKLSKVEGFFKDYEGRFEFDTKTKTLKNINAKVFTKSVDTGDGKRDFHLKDHEFFFSSNFPEMKLTTNNSVIVKTNTKSPLSATLEIRGIKKEVKGNITYKGSIIDPWGKENLFFEYQFELNRKDYGMNWNKEMDQGGYLVGDFSQVTLIIQAQKTGEKTAFSTHMIPSTKAIVERDQLKKGKIKKLSTSTDPVDKK